MLAAAVLALAVSVVWRLGWQTLNPYSWLLPLPALVLLGVAAVNRSTTREVDR